jgi:hypothetical protein
VGSLDRAGAGRYERAVTHAAAEPSAADAQAAFDAIAERLLAEPYVDDKRAFHNPCLRARGKIFAMLVDGELVVKLPAARCAELAGAGRGRPFERGQGRPMREWVTVGEPARGDWPALAGEALAFVRD